MHFLQWIGRKRRGTQPRGLTRKEVMEHNRAGDSWVIICGVVYDVSEFVRVHPGGEDIILQYAGRDCTEQYLCAHAYVNISEVLLNEVVGFVVD